MKSTDFKDRKQYDFAQLLYDGSASGERMYSCFDNFLHMAFAAMRQPVYKLQTGELNAELEEDFLKRESKLRDKSKYHEAMALLVTTLDEQPRDFLGDVYGALEMCDKDFRGQVFTPKHLCDMMVQMTLDGFVPDPSNRLTISEPCVGGGAFVISAWEFLKRKGFGHRECFFWATDISYQCFHMAYVQLSLMGVPAIITRGDTLCPKEDDTHAPTIVGALYPFRESQRRLNGHSVRLTARSRARAEVEFPQITARTRTR